MNCLDFIILSLISLTLVHSSTSAISPSEAVKLLENVTDPSKLEPGVRLLVLDSLDFASILSFPSHDEHYEQLAQDVFKRKYSNKIINIADPKLIGFDDILELDGTVYVKQFGEILRVLRLFGHLITKLSIEYNQFPAFGGVNMAPIVKHINLYCADNLIELDVAINSDYMEFFDKWTKPFKHVEKLAITGRFNKLASSTLTFTEMFKELRSLSLKYVQIIDKNGIDLEFPHLKHLYVQTGQNDKSRFTDDDVEKLLRTNSQIQSLKLERCDLKLLKIVNEVLHDLESLQLINFINFNSDLNDKRIVFENVKYFSVDGDLNIIPEIVEFKNLTEFHLISCPMSRGNWIKFIATNPHLMNLSVKKYQINDIQLKILTEMDLNLSEISFQLNGSVGNETIVDFVRKNQNAKKITFTQSYSLKSIVDIFRKEFQNKYTIILHSNDLESKVILEHP